MSTGDHPFVDLIRRRISVERFDPEHTLDDETIRALVADAAEAPSSFNIQHWRFIAVRRPQDKQRLLAAAYGQRQVADAAVTFIVLGDTAGVDRLPEVLDRAVHEKTLPAARADSWLEMARELYADPELSRDEAIRSACLAAMVLMLAAEARGLASGALIGFDPQQVMREFAVPRCCVPVMLLAVGRALETDAKRKPRLDVDTILSFDDGHDLEPHG